MKIGVRAHDLGKLDVINLKKEIETFGFDGVQLVTNKVFGQKIDEVDVKLVENNFKDQIFLLGAYFNMVHPDENIVLEGISNFKKHLKIANQLTAKYVGTETGSLMGSPWGYVKENHNDESFDKVVKVTKELVAYAKDVNSIVTIEGAYAHVIYSPERLKQLVDTISDDHLKVIVDIYNYLNIDNHHDHINIFKKAIDLLKDKIVIIHLKDYIVRDNKLVQVGLGQGLMDYEKIIELIQIHLKDVYLIFEGVLKEDMESSLSFIKKLLEKRRK